MRSMKICIYWRPTDRPTIDRRPTTDLSFRKFQMAISPQRIIRSTSCLVLGWVFGDGGSNGAIFGSKKSKMAAAAIIEKSQIAIISAEKKTHVVWSSGQNGRVSRRQENSDCSSPEWLEKASWATLHLLDGHSEERPSSAQPYLEDAIELALNKPLLRLLSASGATHWWCMPNNDEWLWWYLRNRSSDPLHVWF